jgi:hypothetical protein
MTVIQLRLDKITFDWIGSDVILHMYIYCICNAMQSNECSLIPFLSLLVMLANLSGQSVSSEMLTDVSPSATSAAS